MRILMLAFVTLTLAACATPQPPETHIDWQAEHARIPPGHALLYVVRPWKPAGHRNLFRIIVDGTPLMGGGMPVRSYFSCVVGAETMRIEAQAVGTVRNIRYGLPFLDIARMDIAPKAGEIAFIRVGSDAQGGPVLKEVKAAEGRRLAEHARMLRVCPR